MTTRVDTASTDMNADGTPEEIRQTTFEFAGDGKLVTSTLNVTNLAAGTTSVSRTDYGYDAAGQNVLESYWGDTNGDGTLDPGGFLVREFDAAGRVAVETSNSPDFNGDGLAGDYQTRKAFYYDAAGRLVSQQEDNFAYGFQAQSDYRDESWTYDAAGRLSAYVVDDPIFFDCVITRTNVYDKAGRLAKITEQNEIRYGDERARIDESFTYNKDGTLKTHTDWADYSDMGWMQRVDTAYTWSAGYDAQRLTYDVQGDWDPEAIKLVEHWYNASGKLTHTLVSNDLDGNGGALPGGYDSRDLFVKTWDGDTIVSETHDYGADGLVEYSFTSQLLVA